MEEIDEIKPPSWLGKINTQQEYYELVGTGMAWVLHPDLPLTWKEFCTIKERWLNE